MASILIADDNIELCNILLKMLEKKGHLVETAYDGVQATEKISKKYFNVIITDLRMPKLDGMEVLQFSKKSSPSSMIIVITAYGTVDNAVKAMHEGAADYILKPFSTEEMEIKVNMALEKQKLMFENKLFKDDIEYSFGTIIGKSPEMQKIYQLIKKIAQTNDPVLILGKSGTGKELVAREIHKNSDRKDKPFVVATCIDYTPEIFEKELFGFTNDKIHIPGKIHLAEDGILFLDEIGELTNEMQSKLLKYLTNDNDNKSNIRIIAATNKETKQSKPDELRDDFLYRVGTVTIALPSLKNRAEDIPDLVKHFLVKYSNKMNRKLSISPEALGILKNYSWPGNVRELENTIYQASILADENLIEPRHLPYGLADMIKEAFVPVTSSGMKTQLSAIEEEIIRNALREANWNQSVAAKNLGLKRTSLKYKMQKYKISHPKKH